MFRSTETPLMMRPPPNQLISIRYGQNDVKAFCPREKGPFSGCVCILSHRDCKRILFESLIEEQGR